MFQMAIREGTAYVDEFRYAKEQFKKELFKERIEPNLKKESLVDDYILCHIHVAYNIIFITYKMIITISFYLKSLRSQKVWPKTHRLHSMIVI